MSEVEGVDRRTVLREKFALALAPVLIRSPVAGFIISDMAAGSDADSKKVERFVNIVWCLAATLAAGEPK